MIADDGAPILMDFGSTLKARIKIDNRQQALLQQVGDSISGQRKIDANTKLQGYRC